MTQLNFHKEPMSKTPPQGFLGSDLPILKTATDAYRLWHGYLTNLPRLSRYTLGSKIDGLFTDTIEFILLAGYANREHKLTIVQKASTKLDTLKFFLNLAWELKLIDHQKYAALTPPLIALGKMLGGWLKTLHQ